jgi:HK97 family phage major capsid protein
MKLSERIKQFIAERAAKVAALEGVQEKALKDGRSKDKSEQEQFDELMGEIEAIDKELSDLRRMEKVQLAQATTVDPGDEEEEDDEIEAGEHKPPKLKTVDGGNAIEGKGRVISVSGRKLAKGILFARYVKCLGAARGDLANAYTLAKLHYSDTPQIASVLKAGLSGGLLGDLMQKAAVGGGSTTDATWAGPLVQYNQFAGDFIEFLRPKTILGQFGVGNIPGLRMVPFNIHIRGQTSGGAGYWVGQGKAKPLTKVDFNDTYLGWSKAAAIAVLSEDLLRFSNPSAELLVRDALGDAIIGRLDTDFVDPTKIAVANVSPASITNGSTTHHSAGATAADCRADIATLMGGFITANISPDAAVWIMQSTTALQLSLLRNAFGQKEFPDITLKGGILEGVPVITSQYVPNESGGAMMILVNASDIWLADDGAVTIDASREASLEMSDAPANDASAPTPATMVSMFQTNSVALRAERFINWQKRRAAAVQVIDDVSYTGG